MLGSLYKRRCIVLAMLITLPYNESSMIKEYTDPVSYLITVEDGKQVFAIDTLNTKILLGTSDNIFVYDLSAEALNDKVCLISTTKSYCKIPMNFHAADYFTSISINYKYPKLISQYIDVKDDVTHNSILLYNIEETDATEGKLNATQYTFDPKTISQQVTLASFVSGGYFYLVGSSIQKIDPLENINPLVYASTTNRTLVKITRLDEADNSETLASRMDLSLDCRSDTTVPITLVSRAHYDFPKDELWFTIHTTDGKYEMCKFAMQNVKKQFDDVLDSCQKSPAIACNYVDESSNKEDCYIMARSSSDGSWKACSNFTASVKADTSDTRQFGWIEYFKPVWEKAVYGVTDDDTIVRQILPDLQHGNTIYAANIKSKNISNIYWKDPIAQEKENFMPVVQISANFGGSRNIDIFQNYLCYIDGTYAVRIVPISCDGFYKTCNSLVEGLWSSPSECMWCPDQGIERAVYENDNTCKKPVRGECPPPNKNDNLATSAGTPIKPPPTVVTVISSNLKEHYWMMTGILACIFIVVIVVGSFILKKHRKMNHPNSSMEMHYVANSLPDT